MRSSELNGAALALCGEPRLLVERRFKRSTVSGVARFQTNGARQQIP